MRTRIVWFLLIGAALVACEPLTPTADSSRGPLKIEAQPQGTDSIPSEFGELVAVTPLADQPHSQMLWFVRADKSIVAVSVNLGAAGLGSVMTIPRH